MLVPINYLLCWSQSIIFYVGPNQLTIMLAPSPLLCWPQSRPFTAPPSSSRVCRFGQYGRGLDTPSGETCAHIEQKAGHMCRHRAIVWRHWPLRAFARYASCGICWRGARTSSWLLACHIGCHRYPTTCLSHFSVFFAYTIHNTQHVTSIWFLPFPLRFLPFPLRFPLATARIRWAKGYRGCVRCKGQTEWVSLCNTWPIFMVPKDWSGNYNCIKCFEIWTHLGKIFELVAKIVYKPKIFNNIRVIF